MKQKIISIFLIIISILSICPVSFADGGGCFDISFTENNGSLTLDEPVCVNGTILFSGIHSGGKEKTLTFKVVDESNEVYAMGETESTSNGRFYFNFGLKAEVHGKNLTAYILSSEETEASTVSFVFNCKCGANRDALKQGIKDVEALISECEAKGISVEYEKVYLNIIKKFDGFLDTYIENGLINEYGHNFNVISNLLDETKVSLCGYLDNTIAEKIAPIYVSSEVTEDGQSLFADVNIKGEIVNQPVFFNGYGHWGDAVSDYSTFKDLGVNYTHFEIGPNSILKPGTEGRKYDINTAEIERVKNIFKTAEDNNVSIMFMTSMHYFPEFIYNNYPEINNNGDGSFPDFMPYNPTHPEVLAAINAFLNAIIPEIKDYKSFHSICLANEPLFISYEYPDYYLAAYRSFLRKKYNENIASLREAYGALFNLPSFDLIGMPTKSTNLPYYNDWREFNDSILTEWFTALKKTVKAIDESIPVQTKISSYISSTGDGKRRIFCGTNYEQWSEIMDLNGCDAWAVYGENSGKIQGKTMWYDFMTSLKDAPVINSEDHILKDNPELIYNENELKFNMADMWQGAIHGRAGSVYWLWDKSSRTSEGTYYYNANLTRRADHVAAIGKINLDLNRLAKEITAIQEKEARCAVLYSNYTQVKQSEKHLASMYEAYRYLQNNGEKVYIVNDTYPEKLNENLNLELLIVPCANYMPERVWTEIEKFINSGKTVIFAESGTSYYNENGKDLDSTKKANVLNNSVRASFSGWSSINGVFSNCSAVQSAVKNVISGFDKKIAVNSTNGETEWTAAEYKDGYVVNLCNFGSTDTNITVSNDNILLTDELFDLTENKAISNNFTLKPYETKLLKVNILKEGMSLWNEDGSEAIDVNAGKITSKVNVSLDANAPFVHFLAVYSGNSLNRVEKFAGNADENGKATSTLNVTISDAEADGCIIKSFLLDNLTNLKPYLQAKVLGDKN